VSDLPESISCRQLRDAFARLGANLDDPSSVTCAGLGRQLQRVGVDLEELVGALSPPCRRVVRHTCREAASRSRRRRLTEEGQYGINATLYGRLRSALWQTGPRGCRAVLWHQGETDAMIGVSHDKYVSTLQRIINASREDAQWEVPWFVARVSYPLDPTYSLGNIILSAQSTIVQTTPSAFAGPESNAITDRFDTVHFGTLGLQQHAHQWLTSIHASALIPFAPVEVAALDTPAYDGSCDVCDLRIGSPTEGSADTGYLVAMIAGWVVSAGALGALMLALRSPPQQGTDEPKMISKMPPGQPHV